MAHRLAWIALALYVLSLCLPAIVVDEATVKLYWGVHCAVTGWVVWPGWLANPLFLAAILIASQTRDPTTCYVAVTLAALAVISAVLAPFVLAVDRHHTLARLHVGYYVWIASTLVLAVATVMREQELVDQGVTDTGDADLVR